MCKYSLWCMSHTSLIGRALPYHFISLVLYLISSPIIFRKSAPNMTLGCELPGKTLPARVGHYPVIGNYLVITW